jgi:hypothetical protein
VFVEFVQLSVLRACIVKVQALALALDSVILWNSAFFDGLSRQMNLQSFSHPFSR